MIVSETYLKLAASLGPGRRKDLAYAVFPVAEHAAQEFLASYGAARIAEVVVEEGSTKLRSRIRTSAIVIGGLVGGYGTIRSGLEYMWRDGRHAAAWMANQIEPLLPEHPDVTRLRAPAPVRLKRLFDSVESGELTADEALERAQAIFVEYQESPETIHQVLHAIEPEIRSLTVREHPASPRAHRVPSPRPPARPTPIRAAGSVSLFRDPKTRRVVVVET